MQIRTFPDGVTWVRWLCAETGGAWQQPAEASGRNCVHCFADDRHWRTIPPLDPLPLVHVVYVCSRCGDTTCQARVRP